MARDNRLDTLKGFLIILVIMGHIIQTIDPGDFINHGVMGLIYIFHMPLFILISGYLTHSPEQEPPRVMWRRILDIFVTLLTFHVISVLWVVIDHGDYVRAAIAFPFGILWYLLSLIYWRIMLYYSPRWLRNRPVVYLAIALLVSVVVGFTWWGNTLSIKRALNFYPFFLLGYFYHQGLINKRWWSNTKLHAAVSVVLLGLIFWQFPDCGKVMNGADHYDLAGVPEKLAILTCSISMCLFFVNIVKDVKWLRDIGKESMFYYLYHIFLVCIPLYELIKAFDLPSTFPYMVLYTAAVTLTLFLMSKVKFFQWLTHPTRKSLQHK